MIITCFIILSMRKRGDYVSNKIIKVQYGNNENEFMEFEIKQSLMPSGGGLGGVSEKIQDVALNVYGGSIEKMTSFLKDAAKKVKDNLGDLENKGITISIGFSLGVNGNFLVTPGAEASFIVEVNL